MEQVSAATPDSPGEADRLRRRVAQLEEEMAALQAAKDDAERLAATRARWLAHVSHEMRTPMSSILGVTTLALESGPEDDQREALNVVWQSADAVLTLVNDLLDHSKIASGKLSVEPVPFLVRDTVQDIVASLAMANRHRPVALEAIVAEDVPKRVITDPGRLRQVLLNLLGNAVKFTDEGSVTLGVDVESAELDRCVLRFRVEDTGVGIAESELHRIFEPFEQASSAVGRGGTGLGLPIAARLVELMGGRITVESVQGEGTAFTFTIEAALDGVQTGRRTPLPGRLRVLVVTPTGDPGPTLKATLSVLGADHVTVTGVEAAQAEITGAGDQPYHVAVVELPEEAVERAAPVAGTGIPVVVVTPMGKRGDSAECRRQGISGYLTGPLTPRDLREALQAVAAGASGLVTRHWLRERRRPLTLLLAEDSPTNREIAVRLLEKRGHTVVAVANGIEAVEAAIAGRFDAVILDVEMPEMGGLEAAREIRRRAAAETLPIVALTGHSELSAAGDAGIDEVAIKPLRVDEVLEALHRLV